MARRSACQGLILNTPFTWIRDTAKTVFAVLPIGSLLQTRFEIGEKTAKFNVSLMGLHGDRDELLFYEQVKAILPRGGHPTKRFRKAAAPRTLLSDLIAGEAYFEDLRSFVNNILPTQMSQRCAPGKRQGAH